MTRVVSIKPSQMLRGPGFLEGHIVPALDQLLRQGVHAL